MKEEVQHPQPSEEKPPPAMAEGAPAGGQAPSGSPCVAFGEKKGPPERGIGMGWVFCVAGVLQ